MPKKSFIVIALDGGAATGKSSTSKILAKHLNLLHVDTGAHYRTISFILLKNNIYPSDVESVVNKLTIFKIDSKIEDKKAQKTINGLLPSHKDLRSPLVNRHVSP